ncbi:hypothetical protein NC653_002987 [Populus alba x Populus x berolinensis]|uniref:Uncharacterized protein n=1 Tax=Populus alba x Populus x berolinensis TaxID=444605 RepID=A0AAD6WIJ8_9ROSI|nr:hypothetical protein NC653_002987 [Populus alba x Populus x berolinensis]
MARDSCLARITAGVAVGGAIGGAVGAVYGTYEAVRYKQNCTGLYTLFDTVNSPVSVHMQVLRRAIHKEDTDEDALSRVIVTRAEKDLKEIKELYLKRNNVSLDQAVAADTHGEYKEFLLTLLGNEKN